MGSPMSAFSVESGLSEPLRISCTHRSTGAALTRDIPEPFAFLGRHPINTVQLDDPSVSKKHAYLQVLDDCAFVVDLGSRTGLRIGGRPIAQGWLAPGQTLEIGEIDVRISGTQGNSDRSSPTALSDGAALSRLALSSGSDSEGLVYCPLRSALTLIGQHPQCNFRLIDGRLRPFHAAVVQTATEAWLVDLLGSGATRLNDRPLRWSRLRVGDRIDLNGVALEVHLNRADVARSDPAGVLEPVVHRMGRYSSAIEDFQPLAEQVGDLRQATLMMAGLFAEMKREQTQMMQRQIELMEVMTEAFRDARRPEAQRLAAAPPVVADPAPPSIPLQTPRLPNPGDEEAFTKAHEWFLSRLQGLGKPAS